MTAVEEKPNDNCYDYSRRNLYFSVIGVYMLFVSVGVLMGWASPAIPKLKEEGHNYTSGQYVLLTSIQNLAPGPLITIFGIDLIGRKGCLFVIWSTLVVAFAILCTTTDIIAMLIARFIGGWGMGAAFSAIGIYISEISDVRIRGVLNTMSILFLTIGLIICYVSNLFLNYFWLTIVCLIGTLLFGLFYFFLPESPYYYVSKGKFKSAQSSLRFLRANASNENIEDELENIKNFVEGERKNKTGIRKLFTSKIVYKQFAVALYLLYMQQASAWGPIISYGQEIFDAAEVGLKGSYVTLAMSVFTLFAAMSAPFLVKMFGTKGLFYCAGFGSGLGLCAVGIYFTLLNGGTDVSSIKYLPIIVLFSLNILIHAGFGGIIWAVVSDLFAPSVKGPATGICGIISTFLGFVSNEVFGTAKDSYGMGPTFIGFGVCLLVAAIGFFFVPDTTKMSFQEIQDHFEGINKSSKNKKVDFVKP